MTINDMLRDGIVLQGSIEVRQYVPDLGEHVTVFSGIEPDGWVYDVDEPWADCQVGYIYSPYGRNGMTIEVGEE